MLLKKTSTAILLIIGILIFVNLVSEQYFLRLDFTEDKRYSLSDATKNILEELEEPVTVKAYFSENLPPDISNICKEFEDFLVEYKRLSNDNIVFDFINPNESEELEKEAMQAGVQPVMINVREKDQVKQQKAYLGVVLELGEQKEVIPFVQPSTPLEYALSTAIKKMMVVEKPIIGFLQGHGEPSLEEMPEVLAGLDVLYTVQPQILNDSLPIPTQLNTLAIVRPKDSIPDSQLNQLDAFLMRGGRLFLALNTVDGNLQTSSGSAQTTGLENWLENKGLKIEAKFILDANCAMVTVQQQQGFFRFASNMSFPFIPIISTFADHPITKGLEAAVMQFVSPIQFTGDSSSTTFTPLAFTSEKSGNVPAPQYFNVQQQWTDQDFPLQHQVVACALEVKNGTSGLWKLVVVGDGDFPVGGGGNNRQQLQPDNVNLMVNAIDWLSDDTGLIELRTKGILFRPIDDLEDGTKTLLKYMNFLVPILLLVLYGLVRMQMNRNKRIKRMQENYE